MSFMTAFSIVFIGIFLLALAILLAVLIAGILALSGKKKQTALGGASAHDCLPSPSNTNHSSSESTHQP